MTNFLKILKEHYLLVIVGLVASIGTWSFDKITSESIDLQTHALKLQIRDSEIAALKRNLENYSENQSDFRSIDPLSAHYVEIVIFPAMTVKGCSTFTEKSLKLIGASIGYGELKDETAQWGGYFLDKNTQLVFLFYVLNKKKMPLWPYLCTLDRKNTPVYSRISLIPSIM